MIQEFSWLAGLFVDFARSGLRNFDLFQSQIIDLFAKPFDSCFQHFAFSCVDLTICFVIQQTDFSSLQLQGSHLQRRDIASPPNSQR